ncbi:hypothetical protein INT44_002584 [Umbelopsis vinacea]|uniref:Uncharacterized protein n=1 Tax=Umbelopsis vinacea TaxID=44442 RepID=A0A8H7UAI9_9FUNG|nr:hypothetical protein INT44_002584 [Umbelopsis vinacea]
MKAKRAYIIALKRYLLRKTQPYQTAHPQRPRSPPKPFKWRPRKMAIDGPSFFDDDPMDVDQPFEQGMLACLLLLRVVTRYADFCEVVSYCSVVCYSVAVPTLLVAYLALLSLGYRHVPALGKLQVLDNGSSQPGFPMAKRRSRSSSRCL